MFKAGLMLGAVAALAALAWLAFREESGPGSPDPEPEELTARPASGEEPIPPPPPDVVEELSARLRQIERFHEGEILPLAGGVEGVDTLLRFLAGDGDAGRKAVVLQVLARSPLGPVRIRHGIRLAEQPHDGARKHHPDA